MRCRTRLYRLLRNRVKGPMFTLFFMCMAIYTLAIVHSLIERNDVRKGRLYSQQEGELELRVLLDSGNTRPGLQEPETDQQKEVKYEPIYEQSNNKQQYRPKYRDKFYHIETEDYANVDENYYDGSDTGQKEFRHSEPNSTVGLTKRCTTHIMFLAESQLGNLMAKYSVLYGLWRKFGAQVYLFPKQYRFATRIFVNLTIANVPDRLKKADWRPVDFSDIVYMLPCDNSTDRQEFLIITDWPKDNGLSVYHEYLEDLRHEFRLHDTITRQARASIAALTANKSPINSNSSGGSTGQLAAADSGWSVNRTVVGIHVRRGDHRLHTWLLHSRRLPGAGYLARAIHYLAAMFAPVQFVIASDDRGYVRRHLLDQIRRHLPDGTPAAVHVLPDRNSQQLDMAGLALCSHVITTVGTFGMFSGVLAGGAILSPARRPGTYSDPFDIQINPTNDLRNLFAWN